MLTEIIMSALPKINGNRGPSIVPGMAYDDLRSKVAALVRPDRIVTAPPQQVPPRAVLRPSLEESAPVLPLKVERSEPVQDGHSIFDILSRATSCFDLLSQKLDQVEDERDEALNLIEEHKRAAASWQEMIETVQARMQDAERDMAEMKQELAAQQNRADTAEDRAARLDAALKQREQRLGEVEQQYANLYEQVMSSFGLGSATHRVLESLVQRFHAKAA